MSVAGQRSEEADGPTSLLFFFSIVDAGILRTQLQNVHESSVSVKKRAELILVREQVARDVSVFVKEPAGQPETKEWVALFQVTDKRWSQGTVPSTRMYLAWTSLTTQKILIFW